MGGKEHRGSFPITLPSSPGGIAFLCRLDENLGGHFPASLPGDMVRTAAGLIYWFHFSTVLLLVLVLLFQMHYAAVTVDLWCELEETPVFRAQPTATCYGLFFCCFFLFSFFPDAESYSLR